MLKTDKNLKPLAELVSLKGKSALITGSASGIGRAMALVLACDLSSYVHGTLIAVDGGFLSA